jgi:hypothetical protein
MIDDELITVTNVRHDGDITHITFNRGVKAMANRFPRATGRARFNAVTEVVAIDAYERSMVFTNCVVDKGVVYFADEPEWFAYQNLECEFVDLIDAVAFMSSSSCSVELLG